MNINTLFVIWVIISAWLLMVSDYIYEGVVELFNGGWYRSLFFVFCVVVVGYGWFTYNALEGAKLI